MKKSLRDQINAVDDIIKSQIVQGGNSERREWAGTTTTDEEIPQNTPNHTDYKPPKPVTHKSLDEASESELEAALAMRKSKVSNPFLAEQEIMSLRGVKKSVCHACNGTRMDALTKSICGDCGGYGFFFDAPTPEIAKSIQRIANKYNVTPVDEFLLKAQKKVEKNNNDESSTTPANGGEMTPVKTDDTGVQVNKGNNPLFDDLDNKLASLESNLVNKGKTTKKGDLAIVHEDDDKPDGVIDIDEELANTKKSLAEFRDLNIALVKSLRSALHALSQQNIRMDGIAKSVSEHEDVLESLVSQNASIAKSLASSPNERRPARAPMSRQSLQVINKSFGDGGGEPVTARDGVEVDLRYSLKDLQKGAGALFKSFPEKTHYKDIVLRIDASRGQLPESKYVNEIQKHLDEHPEILD